MIDFIDPNLNLPQPPAAPSVEPVESIKPETVGIEGDKLDKRRQQRLVEEDRQRRQRRRDTVELSGEALEEDLEEEDDEPSPGEDKDQDSGAIDIII